MVLHCRTTQALSDLGFGLTRTERIQRRPERYPVEKKEKIIKEKHSLNIKDDL